MTPNKVRRILNIIFLVLAVAAVIIYFIPGRSFTTFLYVGAAAIFFKVVEFFIRFTN